MMPEPIIQPCLTAGELAFFASEGYLKIEKAVPASLLQRLQQLFDDLMFHDTAHPDVLRDTKNGKEYIRNIENICNKGNLAALELLGHPFILQVAATICGADFFPVQDFAVIKMKGDDVPVLWHQDMENNRSAPAVTMGIYLDDASEQEGALRLIPRSHTSGKNICSLQQEDFISVPMKAGDILLHDMLTAHSSEPLNDSSLRRVIYFEFLSAELVRVENIYTEDLVTRRTSLVAAALRYYQQQNPGSNGFEWQNSNKEFYYHPGSIAQQLHEIYASPVRARPSAYCFE
jgi:ectoine hydroxylase-related dioxygenase (phytanoyl-CoA dioxygenase family)